MTKTANKKAIKVLPALRASLLWYKGETARTLRRRAADAASPRLIYKAASFKKPTENFTRGCVFNLGDMLRVKGTTQPAAVLPSF